MKNDPDPITTSVVSDGYNTTAIVRVHDNYDPYKEFNDRWCPKPVEVAKSITASAWVVTFSLVFREADVLRWTDVMKTFCEM